MNSGLLQVRGLCKAFGALRATDGVELEVQEGEIFVVMGLSGSGKSTLCGC